MQRFGHMGDSSRLVEHFIWRPSPILDSMVGNTVTFCIMVISSEFMLFNPGRDPQCKELAKIGASSRLAEHLKQFPITDIG